MSTRIAMFAATALCGFLAARLRDLQHRLSIAQAWEAFALRRMKDFDDWEKELTP